MASEYEQTFHNRTDRKHDNILLRNTTDKTGGRQQRKKCENN